MTTQPFVSIIVPVYNNPAGIDLLLSKLVRQTYDPKRYEVIVADNGSQDETLQVVLGYTEHYRALVNVVVESDTQGSYAARNKGISVAKGEIYAFIDSDCDPTVEWIERGIAQMHEFSATAGGGSIEFTFKGQTPNIYEYLDSARKLDQKGYIESAGFAATANFFARAELFEKYGEFRADLISGGDYEFGRRITGAGETLTYLPEALIRHPARDTFRAVYQKSKRIAIGKKCLRDLGLLEHGRLSLKNLIPVLIWPKDGNWEYKLSVGTKIRLILLQNFFVAVRWWIENPIR